MPIINSAFETRLRSLKFQNEPLVPRQLPGVYEETLEGGALKAAVIARSGPEDALRLTRILASPSGLAFIANQALLSSTTFLTNDDKASDYVKDTLQAAGFSAFTAPAQALVNGTGIHLGNEFRINYYPEGDPQDDNDDIRTSKTALNTKYSAVKENLRRHIRLPSVDKDEEIELLKYKPGDEGYQYTKQNQHLFANTDSLSKVVKGSGDNLQVVTERTNPSNTANEVATPSEATSSTVTKLSLSDENNPISSYSPEKVEDLKRGKVPKETRNTFLKVKSRSSLGTQGKVGTAGTVEAIDQINFLGIQDAELEDTYDFIPFKIVIKAPEEPDTFLYFRAYLTDFGDDYAGEWASVDYIGRAEKFYTYNGFTRNIGFGFMVAASTERELLPLYQKLNRLVSTTAPSYSNTFMRGVYTKLTIGDYLKDVPGFFKSFSLSWNTGYPWEVNSNDRLSVEGDLKTPRVPHILNVNCGFQPIHNFSPQYKQPFILDQRYLDASVNV